MNHPLGKTGVHLTSIISTWDSETNSGDPEIRAEVYIQGSNSKQVFSTLQVQKDQIENELGFPAIWHSGENAARCRIFVRWKTDFRNELLWNEQFTWLRQHLEALREVFSPRVKNLAVWTTGHEALASEETS